MTGPYRSSSASWRRFARLFAPIFTTTPHRRCPRPVGLPGLTWDGTDPLAGGPVADHGGAR